MSLLLLLLTACVRALRLVALLNESAGLKHPEQIAVQLPRVLEAFGRECTPKIRNDMLSAYPDRHVFLYMDGPTPVGYLQIQETTGFIEESGHSWLSAIAKLLAWHVRDWFDGCLFDGCTQFRWWKAPDGRHSVRYAVPLLIPYGLCVFPEHRGKSFGERLLVDAVKFLTRRPVLPVAGQSRRSYKRNAMVLLHLSPEGPGITAPLRIYYRIGLTKGIFSKDSPSTVRFALNKVIDGKDIFESGRHHLVNGGAERYILLCTPVSKLLRGVKTALPADSKQIASQLQAKLLMNYNKQIDDEE